jgi:hypothetical protein
LFGACAMKLLGVAQADLIRSISRLGVAMLFFDFF